MFQDVIFKMETTWGVFLGNIGKPTHFSQVVHPCLIAITVRSRRVFNIKQMRQISPFPAPTLQFSGRLLFSWTVFIHQNDSPHSSCAQALVSAEFLRGLFKPGFMVSHLNICGCLRVPSRYFLPLMALSAPESECFLQNQFWLQKHPDLYQLSICKVIFLFSISSWDCILRSLY